MFAVLNKEICFKGSQCNIFYILGYFRGILSELGNKELVKKYDMFSKSMMDNSKNYKDILNELEDKFRVKIITK